MRSVIGGDMTRRMTGQGRFGAAVVTCVALLVLVGPVVWHADPAAPDIARANLRPVILALWDGGANTSWQHPLGTDQLGRDLLAQFMWGGRASLAVGMMAVLLALVLGTGIGVLAGINRRLDAPLMRLTDLFLSLPVLPLVLVAATLFRHPLRAALGPSGGVFLLIVGCIAITTWMPTARIVRGDVLALQERDFMRAARAMGAGPWRIIRRHILPNIASPILVSATLGLATAIITESALSFLGVGFPSDYPSWGRMMADAVQRMNLYPERVILPGLGISLTILGANALGDALRDRLEPRHKWI